MDRSRLNLSGIWCLEMLNYGAQEVAALSKGILVLKAVYRENTGLRVET